VGVVSSVPLATFLPAATPLPVPPPHPPSRSALRRTRGGRERKSRTARTISMNAPTPPPHPHLTSGRILTWWLGLMSVAGVLFGVFSQDRPFGNDILEHPLVVFFVVVGVGLLVLRVAWRRPVPDIIPDRLLVVGCFVGLAAFLIGNWLAVHLLAMR
jgi:hypothetical protein